MEIVSLTSKFGYNLQTVSVVSVLKKSPETHLVSKFMKSDNFYVHLAYMSTQQVTTQTLCRENKSLCSLESAKLKIKGNLLSFIWFLPYRFYRPFGHVVILQNINEKLSIELVCDLIDTTRAQVNLTISFYQIHFPHFAAPAQSHDTFHQPIDQW